MVACSTLAWQWWKGLFFNKTMRSFEVCKESPIDKGRFSSYEYPKSYPGNYQCTWLIKGSSGSVIKITTGTLEFPSCYSTACDYLDIYDGATQNHPKVARFKSGQEIDFVSSHDRLLIVFKSQVLKQTKGLNGFHAQYYSIKKSEVLEVEVSTQPEMKSP